MYELVYGVRLFWGIVILTMISAVIGIMSWESRDYGHKKQAYGSYFDAFERCRNDSSSEFTDDERIFCDNRAFALSKPGGMIVRNITKTVKVPEYVADPYQQLFDQCINSHQTVYSDHRSLETNIRDRIVLCRETAINARASLLAL